MGFQKEIKAALGVANPGDIVESHGSHLLVQQMITEDDKCKVGGFVRAGSSENLCKNAEGSGHVVGIIINDKYYDNNIEGMALPKGTAVTVAIFGVIAVENTYSAASTATNKVYVKDSDGSLLFQSITAGATVGHTDTGWSVKQGCEKGEITFIVR